MHGILAIRNITDYNKNIKNTKFNYLIPEDFNTKNYIDSSFGMYVEEIEYDVELLFSEDVAPLIAERVWHPNQQHPGPVHEQAKRLLVADQVCEPVSRYVAGPGQQQRGPVERAGDDSVQLGARTQRNPSAH